MANSEVIVTLEPGVDVVLTTDNPDIGNLVEEIVRHRETLDTKEIRVSCEGVDNFDKESFAEIVRSSAQQFLDAIKIEKETFDMACSSIKDEKVTGN